MTSGARSGALSAAGTLDDLARGINEAHDACLTARRSATARAREAGELLEEAKARVKHGEWLPWLKTNCPEVTERTAQLYMLVARRWATLAAKAQRAADLPLRKTVALLTRRVPVREVGLGNLATVSEPEDDALSAPVPERFDHLPDRERDEVRRVVAELEEFQHQRRQPLRSAVTGAIEGWAPTQGNPPVYWAINGDRRRWTNRQIRAALRRWMEGRGRSPVVDDAMLIVRQRAHVDPSAHGAMLPPDAGRPDYCCPRCGYEWNGLPRPRSLPAAVRRRADGRVRTGLRGGDSA